MNEAKQTEKKEKLRNQIIGGIVGSLSLAAIYFFIDYNTTDPEVLPTLDIQQDRLELQQEQMAIQQQSLEELEKGSDAIARYVVQQEIKTLTEMLRAMDNRRSTWNDNDRDQHQRLEADLLRAEQTLRKLDETE